MGPDIEAKNQTLAVELQEAHVVADSVRVEQIVWNLVTNAVKFTPEGESLRVELGVEGGMARLTVEDSGIGLDPSHLSDIFEMFRQVETGASRTKAGLGIGLALVKQLAELHGGRVEAESKGLGRGARFSVWLPLAHGEAPSLPAPATGGGLAGLDLLIVDDEAELLSAFGALLESEGAIVTLADGAEAALQLAKAKRFDVIVSDIAMPERDGFWLAARLREDEKTRDTPLVAVSGRARGVDRVRALEAGFNAHVGKPVDLDLLRDEINGVVAHRARPRNEF